jgi:hypothetical protein
LKFSFSFTEKKLTLSLSLYGRQRRRLNTFFSDEKQFSGTVAGDAPPCRSLKTPPFPKLFTSKRFSSPPLFIFVTDFQGKTLKLATSRFKVAAQNFKRKRDKKDS